jgi:tetratricopeptide (TPR) repeat protein
MANRRSKQSSAKVVSIVDHVAKRKREARARGILEVMDLLDQALAEGATDDGGAAEPSDLAADAARFASRGGLEAELGQHDEAFADCSLAIELDGRNARAHAIRGICRIPLGHDESLVMADLDRAVELAPDDWECRYFRGHALAEQCRFAEAFADFDHAIAKRPDVAVLYEERGSARARRVDTEDELDGWKEASLADFDKALALGRRSLDLYLDKALLLQTSGDLAAALDFLDWAAKELPHEGVIFYYRSDVKKALKDETGSKADRERAVELGFALGKD